MKTNSEEIERYLNRIKSHIDYEVGDWVETCHMLPGIVQKIHCGVHKITPEYAIKLLSIGEERLNELWNSCAGREWKEVVEEEFQR